MPCEVVKFPSRARPRPLLPDFIEIDGAPVSRAVINRTIAEHCLADLRDSGAICQLAMQVADAILETRAGPAAPDVCARAIEEIAESAMNLVLARGME